jgi:hypothetical protein
VGYNGSAGSTAKQALTKNEGKSDKAPLEN